MIQVFLEKNTTTCILFEMSVHYLRRLPAFPDAGIFLSRRVLLWIILYRQFTQQIAK